MKTRHHTLVVATLLAMASFSTASVQATTWSVNAIKSTTQTGMPSLQRLSGDSLNNAQQLAGSYYYFNSLPNSFGYATDARGHVFSYFAQYTEAVAINDLGQVAGHHYVDGAFVTLPKTQAKSFIKPFAGDVATRAAKLSPNGRLAGLSCPSDPNTEGFSVSDKCRIFSTAPNSLIPNEWRLTNGTIVSVVGITSTGQLAGTAQLAGQTAAHAVISNPDGTGVRDLGTLGTGYSYASGMNEQGQVAGLSNIVTSDGSETARVFLTGPNGGSMKDIGTLGGAAISVAGVNRAGQVAGSTYDSNGLQAPFITGPNGEGIRNLALEVPAWLSPKLKTITAINDKGDVIAMGDSGQLYLLTPDVPTPLPPAATCTINYRVVQKSGIGAFQAQITVGNLSATAASDWTVTWRYPSRPLMVSSSARLTQSGTSVNAKPKASNKTVAANGTVSFTVIGATIGGKVPAALALSGTLNGQACGATIQ